MQSQHIRTPSASTARPLAAGRGGGHASTLMPSLAEKARLTSLRRSTPDSEAILSSDDEHDLAKPAHSLTSKPARQAGLAQENSWLSDIQSGPPRRPSATTTTSNVSQPPTPLEQAVESGAWPFQTPLSRVSSNPVTTPWSSTGPWSNAHSRIFGEDRLHIGETKHTRDQSLPQSHSIQPTAKTYRSQSYSVGQLESDPSLNPAISGNTLERQRVTPSQQLPHRPSRPSMLSEVYRGGASLGTQDHYGSGSYVNRGATSPLSPEGRSEHVVESSHNPLLRHAIIPRTRHGQTASASDNRSPIAFHSAQQAQPYSSSAYAPEQVIDEESDDYTSAGLTRRFSELTGLGGPGDTSRRSQWHTSLGFGGLPDIPQSRRHSMAELPTRRNSLVAATADQGYDFTPADSDHLELSMSDPHQMSAAQENHQRDMQNRSYAASYFSGVGPALRSRLESTQSPVSFTSSGPPYQTAPPQGIFSRPGQDTPLYLVSFKCARAEVYYVADNTGLEVKEGDLVIVEADRGHDLGTVLNARINWQQAKELKNKANDEHYRWLMMFSRYNQTSEGGTSSGGTGGMMAGSLPERPPSSAIQGANSFIPGMSDIGPRETELKPKMIKRLAQAHEVATLRDKEGNEAKAKRICQQKVNEMKLDMEVLDAEFQTDWKKLTFFYYANSYVNFNVLVTDLFKVYKTRIWMSAINPASLNTTPVPPPRGLGPGAVGGRDGAPGSRSNASRPFTGNPDYDQQYPPAYQNLAGAVAHSFMTDSAVADRQFATTPAQQAYEIMQYGASQAAAQAYNNSVPSYGWGAFNTQAGLGGLGATHGTSYSPGPLPYGTGLAPPRSTVTTSGQSTFPAPSRGPQPVSPTSPPGPHSQYRKG